MIDNPPAADPTPAIVAADGAAAVSAATIDTHTPTSGDRVRTPVSSGYIWALILATFGGFAALVAPIGISLALRVQQLAPDNVEVLGYVVGAGAAVSAISTPLVGMWSDRTRTRFGRRRPFVIGGSLVGVVGLAVSAWSPSVALLTVGWMITQLGWAAVLGSLLLSQADRLPEEQRGKVAGLSGVVQMVASVAGVGLASAFIGNNYLVFLVPGAVGLVFATLWTILVKEPSSIDLPAAPRLGGTKVLANMVFNPRQHTDFAWNWLGRLLFNFGVTFATTFTTLFFAARLSTGGQVADIGGIVVVLSLLGVVATAGGALLGGLLSDRIKRRRIFVLIAGLSFTAGAIVMAAGGSNVALLIAGSLVTSLGLGVFSAVDQAIVLDVLPNRDTEPGRFLGINNYATSIAQALAPIIAVPLLVIGVTGADKNYALLFIVASACTLVGGTLIMLFVRGSK